MLCITVFYIWLLAYNMTWGNPPPFIPDPPKQGKVVTPEQLAGDSEHSQQAALFCWSAIASREYYPLKYLHAIPNGGLRDVRTAVSLKAEGVKAGVLDVFLPCGMGIYYGCYIELKTEKRRKQKNGGLTEEQIDFMMYCGAANYYCKVCYSWIEARDTLVAYLEGRI